MRTATLRPAGHSQGAPRQMEVRGTQVLYRRCELERRLRRLRIFSARGSALIERSPDGSVSLPQADVSQKVLKPSIGPQRIEGRPHEDGRVEARGIGFVQPVHGLVVIS